MAELGHSREEVIHLEKPHCELTNFLGFDDQDYGKVANSIKSMCSPLSSTISSVIQTPSRNLRRGMDQGAYSSKRLKDQQEFRGKPAVLYIKASILTTLIACLESLAGDSMYTRQWGIPPPLDGTCDWILNHETFKAWLGLLPTSSSRSILHVNGNPGTGKSVAIKFVSDTLANRGRDEFLVATVFVDAKLSWQKTKLGILRTLAHQILTTKPELFNTICDAKQQRQPGVQKTWATAQWTSSVLERFLVDISIKQRLLIFVDGLDECDDAERSDIAWILRRLISPPNSRAGVCVASRPFPSTPLGHTLPLRMEHHNEVGIDVLVSTKFAAFNISGHEWLDLKSDLIKRASGGYLWASLAVDVVLESREAGLNIKAVRDRLKSVPHELYELYGAALSNSNRRNGLLWNKDHAHRLFQWVIYSFQPLRLREWQHIMGLIRTEGSLGSWQKWESSVFFPVTFDDLAKQIRSLSAGMVEAVTCLEEIEPLPIGPSSVFGRAGSLESRQGETTIVRVIHETVREFFLSGPGFSLVDENCPARAPFGHFWIFRHCLDYLFLSDWDELIKARQLADDKRSEEPEFEDMDSRFASLRRKYPPDFRQRGRRRPKRGSSVASFGSAGSFTSQVAGKMDSCSEPKKPQPPSTLSPSPSPPSPQAEKSLLNSELPARSIDISVSADPKKMRKLLESLDQEYRGDPDHILGRFVAAADTDDPPNANMATEDKPRLSSSAFTSVSALSSRARQLETPPQLLPYASYRLFDHAVLCQDLVASEKGQATLQRLKRAWPRILALREDLPHSENMVGFCLKVGLQSWLGSLCRTGDDILDAFEAARVMESPREVLKVCDQLIRFDICTPLQYGSKENILQCILRDRDAVLFDLWCRQAQALLADGLIDGLRLGEYLNQGPGSLRVSILVLARIYVPADHIEGEDMSDHELADAIETLLSLGASSATSAYPNFSPLAYLCQWCRFQPFPSTGEWPVDKWAASRVAQALIEHGEPVNQIDKETGRSLILTLISGPCINLDLLRVLAESGADLEVSDTGGKNALHYINGFVGEPVDMVDPADILEALSSGQFKPSGIQEAMEQALSSGKYRLARAFMDQGALVSTPVLERLFEARSPNAVEFAAPLFPGTIRVGAVLKDGQTALHMACKVQNNYMVELLLEKGADPNARDADGNAPFHLACRPDSLRVYKTEAREGCIKSLVARGAHIDARNDANQDVLDLARESSESCEAILKLWLENLPLSSSIALVQLEPRAPRRVISPCCLSLCLFL